MKMQLHNQRGSVAVLMVAALTVLLGFLGLVVDFGQAYLVKTKMQSAVDAAALGGASKLPASSLAIQQALSLIQANAAVDAQRYYDPGRTVVSVAPFSDPKYPGASACVSVTLSRDVETQFLKVFNVRTIPVSVRADAIVTTGGGSGGAGSGGGGSGGASPFDYALYSAGNYTVGLRYPADGKYKGSIYSGGNISFAEHGITVNGDVVAKGSISKYDIYSDHVNGSMITGSTQNLALPDYKNALAQVVQTSGGQVYSGTKSVTGNISGNLYAQNGKLTLGANATTVLTGTAVIMADGDITINSGNVTMTGSSQVIVYSTNGNVKFSGGGGNWPAHTVVVYAPNGSVDAGGGNTRFAAIVAQQVSMGGGSIDFDRAGATITLPGAAGTSHVRLIR